MKELIFSIFCLSCGLSIINPQIDLWRVIFGTFLILGGTAWFIDAIQAKKHE